MFFNEFSEWCKKPVITAVSLGIGVAIYSHKEEPHPPTETPVEYADYREYQPTIAASGSLMSCYYR